MGIRRVTDTLKREGILYRGGKKWSKQRVQERLQDRVYVGEWIAVQRTGMTGERLCEARGRHLYFRHAEELKSLRKSAELCDMCEAIGEAECFEQMRAVA